MTADQWEFMEGPNVVRSFSPTLVVLKNRFLYLIAGFAKIQHPPVEMLDLWGAKQQWKIVEMHHNDLPR